MPLFINLKSETALVNRTANTNRFFKDIYKYPTMSKEEEKEWFQLMHNGTKAEREYAREYIINCNQRFVVAVAKKWATPDNFLDYINEANIGLIEAVDEYDETKDIKFSTYAIFFVMRSINNYNNTTAPLVKKTNLSKTFHVIAKAENDFYQTYQREPTNEELKEIINTTYKKNIKDGHDLLDVQFTSIDDSLAETYECMYGDINDFRKTTASVNEYEVVSSSEYNNLLTESLLGRLADRERKIICMSFGLIEVNGIKREFTISEIAEELDLTKERVRQLKKSSIDKLKSEYKNRLNRLA